MRTTIRHSIGWQAAILGMFGLAGCGVLAQPAPSPALLRGDLQTNVLAFQRSGPPGYQPFFGITHTHVAEFGDDGQGTLAEAYAFARKRAKLDFLAVSAHSHMINDAGYRDMAQATRKHTQDGQFVALLAQEWSSISKGGHINIFEADSRCALPNGSWDEFYKRWLPNHPEVGWVQFNHPHPSNKLEFGGLGFSPVANSQGSIIALDKVTGMALLNGPGKYSKPDMQGVPDAWDRGANRLNYEIEYLEFLNRGWRVGALGDQDNHVANWGLAVPTRTGIWAKRLTREGITEAMQARRTFATFDHNTTLWFEVNGVGMGGTVSGGKELVATVQALDPDTPIARLELFADVDGVGGKPAKIIARENVRSKNAAWKVTLPAAKPGGYFFAKVILNDKKAWAWSSPIWVRGTGRGSRN